MAASSGCVCFRLSDLFQKIPQAGDPSAGWISGRRLYRKCPFKTAFFPSAPLLDKSYRQTAHSCTQGFFFSLRPHTGFRYQRCYFDKSQPSFWFCSRSACRADRLFAALSLCAFSQRHTGQHCAGYRHRTAYAALWRCAFNGPAAAENPVLKIRASHRFSFL